MRISAAGGKPEFTGVEREGAFRWFSLNRDGSRLAVGANESLGGWEVFAMDNVLPALKASK